MSSSIPDTYPWWPAVVVEPDDPAIPENVMKQGEIVRQKRHGPVHLVQFYDKSQSWYLIFRQSEVNTDDSVGNGLDLISLNTWAMILVITCHFLFTHFNHYFQA